MNHAAGEEMAFWILLFAMIAVACGLNWLLAMALKLRTARSEIARLRAEVRRCRTWLHHNADHWQVGDGRVRHP